VLKLFLAMNFQNPNSFRSGLPMMSPAIAVPPRPTTEVWRGKNWACAQAVEQAYGEYLLFIDADVRLEKGAIAAALTQA
jgi:cellulose synthase/poly-beta-1,6-N-acetylglucosamine synthase-like glycosyltransferase